ncbi:MAG: endonuclease [Deltaproteobacteria bacterium]|jgi:deoxyribonuclease-1|nr:endonuclease [Deltaproteobacteria bacterium]MBW2530865.1 endonuclease [Deltaproteobacteria bacterium]
MGLVLGCQRPQPAPADEPTTTSAVAPSAPPGPEAARRAPHNRVQQSFNRAKRDLRRIYEGHETTFYCGCAYLDRTVDHRSCGYVPRNPGKRAQRVEWEHVVPAHAFGKSFVEWREGDPRCVSKGKRFKGRDCARKVSTDFRYMEADMYNLVPVIGEVNQHRSNFSFAELEGEPRAYGACDFEVVGRKVEPRAAIRGDIARIYLYMAAAYPGRGILSRKSRRFFEAWAADDPVDRWECERAERIAEVQGNRNEVVASACASRGVSGAGASGSLGGSSAGEQ